MIIKIFDSNKEELNENDVVLLRYPNKKIIWLGILLWREDECRFSLSDGDGEQTSFPGCSTIRIEKIGTLQTCPGIEKLLGRSVFANKKEIEKFYSKLYACQM